jgi:hypothetical protein
MAPPPVPSPPPPGADAGTPAAASSSPLGSDAGIKLAHPAPPGAIRWPEELRPLAVLDGPAVIAAHAALQQLLARLPRKYSGSCAYSAKAYDVVVGEEGGVYFVRIDQRMDRCGWAPGTITEFDSFELYAVSPDGRGLERYSYSP